MRERCEKVLLQELPRFVLLRGMVECGLVSEGPGKAVGEVLYEDVVHECSTWVGYMDVVHECDTWVWYMGVVHRCGT